MTALNDLNDQFWTWRTANQPDSYDDVTRVARPVGWTSDWSKAAIAARRKRLRAFTHQFAALDLTGQPVAVQVNGRLLGSALARAHWELELLRSWERDPRFYVDQSLVPLYNGLLRPQPFSQDFSVSVIAHLRQVPRVLAQARDNLIPSAEFAFSAAELLDGMEELLAEAMTALSPSLPDEQANELPEQTRRACAALASFRQWLLAGMGNFDAAAAVGPDAFSFYLHRVALLPYDTAQMRAMAAQEWNRAVAAEMVARRRAQASPVLPPPADLGEQVAAQQAAEVAVRQFYLEHDLLSQPQDLRRYRVAATPPYLLPLTRLGCRTTRRASTDPAMTLFTTPRLCAMTCRTLLRPKRGTVVLRYCTRVCMPSKWRCPGHIQTPPGVASTTRQPTKGLPFTTKSSCCCPGCSTTHQGQPTSWPARCGCGRCGWTSTSPWPAAPAR